MFIYSEKIVQFIDEVHGIIREVLSREFRLKVMNRRFFDASGCYSYPISVVIYNDRRMLGYFDPTFYELGFHETLMYTNRQQLYRVVRHELAHYILFLQHGQLPTPHGPEFRALCRQMGWGEEVYAASMDVTGELQGVQESDVFRKVQKLMALATSSNPNEAEQALLKSQQLLLKHHIEPKYLEGSEEEKTVLKRILKQPQTTAKMKAIAKILETFFVSVVFHRRNDGTYLEILGSPINVQIAEYVAEVLQSKLDDLWTHTKQQHRLKGALAKNSFFLGVAKGYSDKVQALKKAYRSEETTALLVIEKQLQQAKAMAYPSLRYSTRRTRLCSDSSALGESAGRGLSINPGVDRSAKQSGASLSYQSNR